MNKKRYKVKPRFFLVVIIVICLIAGAGAFLLRGCSGSEGDAVTAANIQTQSMRGRQMMQAARAYIMNEDLRYDDSYFAGGYPPDDIGVCTDVVWKAFLGIGVDIKALVDEDIAENYEAYADIVSVPDPNIDFRLVPQLERFFERNAQVLTTDPNDILAWRPGDIVTFESSHVAIVSSFRNLWGQPYIIQHGKDPAAEEDRIAASDGMEISGHFRWPLYNN